MHVLLGRTSILRIPFFLSHVVVGFSPPFRPCDNEVDATVCVCCDDTNANAAIEDDDGNDDVVVVGIVVVVVDVDVDVCVDSDGTVN
mmetsp:Transcript_19304/g.20737  ORF Transcript_19304/g.20737 Transcript_19304/m.20737 type:complete len:87 (-) Transcript_19304:685-945(-)